MRPSTKKDEAVIGADRNAVIQAIRAARLRAGLTQEAAAALTHHATSTISRWETGGLPNKWDDLIEYAHAMNQSIVLEFGHSPDTTKQPPPEWARDMETNIIEALKKNRHLIEALTPAELAQIDAEIDAGLTRHEPPPDEPHPTGGPPPLGGAGSRQR